MSVIMWQQCDVCVSSFCCRSFDRAIEEWRQFHCDTKDLSQWLTDTETLLSESIGPDGQLDLNSARQHQEVSGGWRSTWICLLCKCDCLNLHAWFSHGRLATQPQRHLQVSLSTEYIDLYFYLFLWQFLNLSQHSTFYHNKLFKYKPTTSHLFISSDYYLPKMK